jgi:CheY-like chemotaxis protein
MDGKTLLLIDDDVADARLAQEAMREAGLDDVTLLTAPDAESAFEILYRRGPYAGTTRPDLILLDLNLPRASGHDFLRDIKSNPLLKVIPVIVLTTSGAERDVAKAYAAHANCYMVKPFDLGEFVRVLRDIHRFWFGLARLPRSVGEKTRI